ncbi:MAG TPA: STAS domain-containing protein [Kofleriaceae bacterium]|nr:STAS domain-containing protein [Kofleriaceae bacterium]
MPAIPTRLRLTSEDKAAMAEYWRFFEPLADEINAELRESLLELPEWAPLIKAMSEEQLKAQNKLSMERQRKAIVDGNWAPYLEDTRAQGTQYARAGVSFVAWYDIIAIYREAIRRRLVTLAKQDPERATRVAEGMNRWIDIAMSHLGEAYLDAKERIITHQQEAIRELSVPVLQVREGLLILPLVGMVDSGRARQLMENMLAAIRDHRAKGIVIDVTGVPVVDTAVANHLLQASEAAKLMGAMVVITGISASMAQTLTGLGAPLPDARTVVDLQEGLEVVERALGYR